MLSKQPKAECWHGNWVLVGTSYRAWLDIHLQWRTTEVTGPNSNTNHIYRCKKSGMEGVKGFRARTRTWLLISFQLYHVAPWFSQELDRPPKDGLISCTPGYSKQGHMRTNWLESQSCSCLVLGERKTANRFLNIDKLEQMSEDPRSELYLSAGATEGEGHSRMSLPWILPR
jgi:hypothetical protein